MLKLAKNGKFSRGRPLHRKTFPSDTNCCCQVFRLEQLLTSFLLRNWKFWISSKNVERCQALENFSGDVKTRCCREILCTKTEKVERFCLKARWDCIKYQTKFFSLDFLIGKSLIIFLICHFSSCRSHRMRKKVSEMVSYFKYSNIRNSADLDLKNLETFYSLSQFFNIQNRKNSFHIRSTVTDFDQIKILRILYVFFSSRDLNFVLVGVTLKMRKKKAKSV